MCTGHVGFLPSTKVWLNSAVNSCTDLHSRLSFKSMSNVVLIRSLEREPRLPATSVQDKAPYYALQLTSSNPDYSISK